MATFTPGPLVGRISGKLSGCEFALTKGTPTIRPLRRRRPQQTGLQNQYSAYLALFKPVWDAASADLRQAWASYATANTTTNRFGQPVPQRAYLAAFRFHMYMFQWLDLVIPDPVVLAGPPAKTSPPGEQTNPQATFTDTPSYSTLVGLYPYTVAHVEHLWAGPCRYDSYATRFNWRFIGTKSYDQTGTDWTSYFTGSRLQWEFPQGTRIMLKIAHSLASYPTGMNRPTYISTVITHA